MIPADFITEWGSQAPWVESSQVEQDLVISRALVEIFEDDRLSEALAFRGGTALYKLHLTPSPRYSEDLDLVQRTAEPIGPTIDRLRARLDSWLGDPKRFFKEGRVTLVYRFHSWRPIWPGSGRIGGSSPTSSLSSRPGLSGISSQHSIGPTERSPLASKAIPGEVSEGAMVAVPDVYEWRKHRPRVLLDELEGVEPACRRVRSRRAEVRILRLGLDEKST